jgi:hypothetical protein
MRPDMLDCNVLVRRKQNRRLVSAQPLASRIWGMVVIKTCRAKSARIIAPMTQALKAANGVIAPPPLQHWLNAVLLLCVRLVHGVAATLGMIFKRNDRDWHTADACEDLPRAKYDIQLKKESNTAVVAATRTATPPPNGGGATRTMLNTSGFRWGTALTNRTVRTRRHTAPHLTWARRTSSTRGSSPVRGRKTSAHA